MIVVQYTPFHYTNIKSSVPLKMMFRKLELEFLVSLFRTLFHNGIGIGICIISRPGCF
jgi:hypothetical protein